MLKLETSSVAHFFVPLAYLLEVTVCLQPAPSRRIVFPACVDLQRLRNSFKFPIPLGSALAWFSGIWARLHDWYKPTASLT